MRDSSNLLIQSAEDGDERRTDVVEVRSAGIQCSQTPQRSHSQHHLVNLYHLGTTQANELVLHVLQ